MEVNNAQLQRFTEVQETNTMKFALLASTAAVVVMLGTSADAARDPIIGGGSDFIAAHKGGTTLKAHWGGAQDGHQKDYARTERETPPGDDDDDGGDGDGDGDSGDDDDDGGCKDNKNHY